MPILILNLTLILVVASFGIGLYFYDTVIRTDSLVRRMRGKVTAREPADTSFFDSKDEEGLLENVYMQSEDDLLLHGVIAYAGPEEADRKKWAVICHGYTTDAASMGDHAELFSRMGFCTLCVDLRGHGDSEGKYRGMGWPDSFDVLDWTDWLTDHFGEDIGVVLFGISMGGATVMMASGHDIQEQIRCIVEDCGYTSIKDELKYQMKRRYGLPPFPLLYTLSFWTRLLAGYSIRKDGSCVAQVRRSKTPILFIHGEKDVFVPYKMHKKLYKSAGSEKESYTVENAGHCEALKTDENEYFSAVSGFVGRHFDVAETGRL